VPFKQARKALELAVPILLSALGDHRARRIRHDDLIGSKGRCAENANRMIVGQNDVADRLVGNFADLFDDFVRKARGRLRLNDHHAVIANDHARVRITLSGEGPEAVSDFSE